MTSDVDELLERLNAAGVRLWAVGERIRWRAPGAALAPELEAQIRSLTGELRRKLELRNPRRRTSPRIAGAEAVWSPTAGQTVLVRMKEGLRISDVRLWRKAIDVDACQRALDRIMQRHSILRTRYVTDESDVVWAVTEPTVRVPIESAELSGIDARERARRMAMEIVQRPFSLNTGPLLRFALLRLRPEEVVSVLAICHSIADAWSVSVLVKELIQLYHEEARGVRAQLPLVGPSFADYARIQNEWLETDEAYRHWLYFRAQLAEARQPLWLPIDRVTPSHASNGALTTKGGVGHAAVAALRDLARDTPTTLMVCMLAAIGALLSHWAGRPEVFVWIMRSGRESPEVWGSIGLYADSLLLRMRFESSMSFREALIGVKDAYIDVLPHARVTPVELAPLIVRAQRGERIPEAVIINFLPYPAAARAMENETLFGKPLDWIEWPGRFEDDSPFGFNMFVWESADGLRWMIQHKSALFEDATIERVSAGLADLLAAVAEDSALQLGTLYARLGNPSLTPASCMMKTQAI